MKMRELKVGDKFQLVRAINKETLLKTNMMGEFMGICNCINLETNTLAHCSPSAEVVKVE